MLHKIDGDLIIREYPAQHYKALFNQRTGFFMRVEDDGYSEPFWAEEGPELLDISITNYCERGCLFCYRKANSKGHHMSLDSLKHIINQAKNAGVFQIALGGGNPNQHPYFKNVLRIIRENDIVPSYTTNGDGLSEDILTATKTYCGAMAVSLYEPYKGYDDIFEKIHSMGIKCNAHVILKTDTIDILTDWFRSPPHFFQWINAIVILNYKPIIPNSGFMVKDVQKLQQFYEAVSSCNTVKVGFDSCSVPGIVSWMDVNPALIESCESARFSAFISEDLKMYPCSFMANTDLFGDLKSQSLIDIWHNHPAFVAHREKIKNNNCLTCKAQKLCNGGCIFLPQINQCHNTISNSMSI